MSEFPSKAEFAETVNSEFHIKNADGLTLELIELREGVAPPKLENFSLLFRGPRSEPLPQRTHEMEHPVLGELSLFLVPVGQDQSGTYYESVFNRSAVKQGG